MSRARTPVLLALGAVIVAASCSSVDPMSDVALAECTEAARAGGSIGGSGNLPSTVIFRVLDEAIAPEGSSEDEVEAAFKAAFNELYGIPVDEFLAFRDDADATTTAQHGEPPAVGEHVSDEWFVHRDTELMQLWNERHPESARTFCELVADEATATQ